MIALQIDNIKAFMSKLLLGKTFDSFLVSEAQITTFASFSIDGQFHPEFYDSDDDPDTAAAENASDGHITWKSIRPVCLEIIKGKRLPVSFRIVLQMSSESTAEMLEENGLNIAPEDIFGLFLNIQYRGNTLTVTTGSSLRVFNSDRAVDQAWDRTAREFLTVEELL